MNVMNMCSILCNWVSFNKGIKKRLIVLSVILWCFPYYIKIPHATFLMISLIFFGFWPIYETAIQVGNTNNTNLTFVTGLESRSILKVQTGGSYIRTQKISYSSTRKVKKQRRTRAKYARAVYNNNNFILERYNTK